MILLDENCRSVLVADDSAETRLFFRALIQSMGCKVIEAPDGEVAVEIVCEKCPDLIFLDLNMPKLDGLATAEKIREIKGKCEWVPIVAITAFHTYGIEDAAIAAGCSDYLRKPIDENEFDRVLQRFFPLSP